MLAVTKCGVVLLLVLDSIVYLSLFATQRRAVEYDRPTTTPYRSTLALFVLLSPCVIPRERERFLLMLPVLSALLNELSAHAAVVLLSWRARAASRLGFVLFVSGAREEEEEEEEEEDREEAGSTSPSALSDCAANRAPFC